MTLEQITDTELATFEDACTEHEQTEDSSVSGPSDDEDMDEVETSDDFHELYLPFDTSSYDKMPITFSGGMSYDQCNEYYRVLELEEARRTSKRRRHRFFLGRGVGGRSSKAARTATTTFEFDLSANDSAHNEDTQLVDSIAVSAPCGKAIRRGSDASTASTASTSSSSLSSSASSSGSSSRITFNDTVTVFKVPSFEDVPDDVWQATWKSRQEVRAHKKLSKKEYAWDGYDWQNATEEDDMILDPTTGTLEHPVHYEGHSMFSNSKSTGPTFALRLGLSR